MKSRNPTKPILSTLLLFFAGAALFSQKMTFVKGVVTDAETNETLPFVNLAFKGTAIGTTTDIDGAYVLESKWASDAVQVSFVGYETQTIPIELGARQEVNIALKSTAINIKTVEVKAKKGGYKRKDNPAVALIKNVIAHKADNRMESEAFYEYDRYEKVEFDINNFDPEKLKKRRALKKFQFLFDYVDTSDLNGKPYLPFFIQETSSKVYYRKSTDTKKEYRGGVKVTGIEDYVDLQDFTTMLEVLYQEINIYDDNVRMLDLAFMSPLSPLANATYRFYITDTAAVVNDMLCTKLTFFPINNQNIAFKGDLYIVKDSSYAVAKADFGIARQINLNFIQDLKLVQEFSLRDSVWVLSKDQLTIDFAPFKKGTGVFGTREVSYKNHVFDAEREESIYSGSDKVVAAADAYKKDDAFWESSRHDTLTKKEQGIYEMIDTLQSVPAFKTVVDVMALLFTGYKAFGPVDVGPIGAFYSFNPVEGLRLKAGGETNLKFNKKISLGAYAAYGFKDQEMKYGSYLLYSFRNDFKVNPKHYVRFFYQHEVNIVGQILEFSSADNFFLSFQRGNTDRMFFIDKYQTEYFVESKNGLSFRFQYLNTTQKPIGGLHLEYLDQVEQELKPVSQLRTSEANFQFRFAPNEQFVQGRTYRIPIFNRYPVFTFNLGLGLKNVLGGEYTYQRASLNVFRRFYMSLFGTMRFEAEVGKVWGDGVPYLLLHLPRANQSFAYRTGAFNMMNYMEFVSDEYASINIEHFFNGFFFNKIPLLRKAKLREVVTFKGVYGRLTDKNDPQKNPELINFLNNDDGVPVTYTLEGKPYLEASFGVANIAKFLRIDAVRRLTYLDNPDVPTLFGVKGLGLRIKIKFEF